LSVNAAFAAQVVPGELVVGFEPNTTVAQGSAAVQEADATVAQRLRAADAAVVELDSGQSVSDALADLRASDEVAWAEPNYTLSATGMSSDTLLTGGTLWGLFKIKAAQAWDTSNGGGVVVAVTDSGVDLGNPELSPRLWTNPDETANGVDDDGNGIVDDLHGADFVTGDGSPDDEEGHGTHVSGTIGAAADDGMPNVGVAPGSQLMALKFLDGQGNGNVADAIVAIDYAIAHGAKVINASWGGAPYSKGLEDAIRRADAAGAVFVAAAGNESSNNDQNPTYPAAYSLPNTITVAASDRHNRLASFSNWGAGGVDLAAPGQDIVSNAGAGYESWNGTSMAAPHASGVAALVRSRVPGASAAEVVNAVVRGAKPVKALRGKVATGGVLNAPRALYAADNPGADLNGTLHRPSYFSLRSPGRRVRVGRKGRVKFRWTASTDDDLLGYEIRVDGRVRAFVADPDTDGPKRARTSVRLRVKPGNHRWSVVAVDESGYTRVARARGGKRAAKLSVRRK
jgi:subtilisin family serine protease